MLSVLFNITSVFAFIALFGLGLRLSGLSPKSLRSFILVTASQRKLRLVQNELDTCKWLKLGDEL